MKNKLTLIILLLISVLSYSVNAQETSLVEITSDFEQVNLTPFLKALPVSYSTPLRDVILQGDQFLPYEKGRFFDEGHKSAFLKFTIKNNTTEKQSLYIGTSLFDSLIFYLPGEVTKWKEIQGGITFSNIEKGLSTGYNSFASFELEPFQIFDIYIYSSYIEGSKFQFYSLPLTVLSKEAFKYKFTNVKYLDFAFLGALFIMFIYNMVLLFITKDVSYLYYVCYIFAALSYVSASIGMLSEYFFIDNSMQQELVVYAGIVSIFWYVIFAQKLLSIKTINLNVYNVLRVCLALFIITFVFNFLFGVTIPVLIAIFSITPVALVAILVLAIKEAKKGNQTAIYYLVASGLYITGVMGTIAQMLGFLPNPWYGISSNTTMELGVAFQLALFSLALGNKINSVKQELATERMIAIEKEKDAEKKQTEFIKKQNELLEEKVTERTFELSEANQELATLNEEITSTLETVQVQNETIAKANKNITASINYAKRIQNALLPQLDILKMNFPDIFLVFKPRDIVSGDFYWFVRKNGLLHIAAVDCTGHGVPGGFMSMLGSELLTEIVDQNDNLTPGMIIKMLDTKIKMILNQDSTDNKDGMDLALCIIDPEQEILTYAGAKNPLVYVKDNTIERVKGSIFGVGGQMVSKESVYPEHQLSTKDTTFYIFSDGYQDQLGGPNNRKFMSKKFRELLLASHQPSLERQKQTLEVTLENWMLTGRQGQIDDILVMGFRV